MSASSSEEKVEYSVLEVLEQVLGESGKVKPGEESELQTRGQQLPPLLNWYLPQFSYDLLSHELAVENGIPECPSDKAVMRVSLPPQYSQYRRCISVAIKLNRTFVSDLVSI